jgi:hypothetical protein
MAEISPTLVSAVVLEYGGPATAGEPADGVPRRAAFLLVSLVAAASLFLPFTFSTSPWDVISGWDGSRLGNDLLLIAWPFLLGLLSAAWDVRQLIRPGGGTRLERIAVFIPSVAAVLTTAFVWGRAVLTDSPTTRDLLQLAGGPVILACGIMLLGWLLRRGRPAHAAAVALHTGYATNAAVLLLVMASPDHPGWWATLIAVIGMAARGAAVARRALGRG